eukprot:s23_g32.t1
MKLGSSLRLATLPAWQPHHSVDIILAYGSHTPGVSVQDATYNLQDQQGTEMLPGSLTACIGMCSWLWHMEGTTAVLEVARLTELMCRSSQIYGGFSSHEQGPMMPGIPPARVCDLKAVVQRADLGEETFENFCQDEEFPLRLLYTAMPAQATGAAHRVNIYEAKSEDLGSRGDARQKKTRLLRGLRMCSNKMGPKRLETDSPVGKKAKALIVGMQQVPWQGAAIHGCGLSFATGIAA